MVLVVVRFVVEVALYINCSNNICNKEEELLSSSSCDTISGYLNDWSLTSSYHLLPNCSYWSLLPVYEPKSKMTVSMMEVLNRMP